MGIEIRLFLVIDAFSRFSGMALACFAGLSLALAEQLLDSTAAESGCGRGPTGPTLRPAPGAPSGTRLSPPRITRFYVPHGLPMRSSFAAHAENSRKSRVSPPLDTQRGGGLASRPIVPRRSCRQGLRAGRPALASASGGPPAALTAALRRGAFDSGNPAPGHEAAPDGASTPSGAWPRHYQE